LNRLDPFEFCKDYLGDVGALLGLEVDFSNAGPALQGSLIKSVFKL